MALTKTVGMGASANAAAPASAGPGTVAGWHPSILYLLGLVIAEVLVVAWLSRHLLKG